MTNYTMELKDLKRSISLGNTKEVIEELIEFTEGTSSNRTTEIYHTAARFRQLESEKLRGEIAIRDYKLEYNSITLSLLEIIDSIDISGVGAYQHIQPKEQIRQELALMSQEFAEVNKMKSPVSQLRMRIHIARKMAEKLIPWPDLIKEYRGTTDEAMICAISRKVKIIPDVEDLSILESVAHHAKSNVAKGFVVNALMELMYAGQLRIGDDEHLQDMLNILGQQGGDLPLMKNVERVQAALDYLTGKARR